MNKLFFLDVETTGLDSKIHGLTQLSGYIEIDHHLEQSFNFEVKPFPDDKIDPEALKITGKSHAEILLSSAPPVIIFNLLKEILEKYVDPYSKSDKFFLVAYNANFDADFLRQFFLKNNDKYFGSFFHYPPIDIAVLAVIRLMKVRHKMVNFKLSTVAQEMGIKIDESKLHDAMYDIELTRKIFHLLPKELKNVS